MKDPQEDKSALPTAGAVVLATIIGAFVYHGFSLHTSRPIDRDTPSHISPHEGLAPARLWQDPFEAVETNRLNDAKRRGELGETKSEPHLARQIESIISSIPDFPRLRVLPVFVDGNPYSSGNESRLNSRYAIVSALGAAGYVPESGEHIRFLTPTDCSKPCGPIPAELFIPKAKLKFNASIDGLVSEPVLILWLKEQDFSITPLAQLNQLFNVLNKQFSMGKTSITLIYKVIGPRFSTGLSEMLMELKKMERTGLCTCTNYFLGSLQGVEIFSPWVTAQDIFLLNESPYRDDSKIETNKSVNDVSTRISTTRIEDLFECGGMRLIRTIDNDAKLIVELLQELSLRNVNLPTFCQDKGCTPRVGLISEWDTLYGRALPRTFAAVALTATRSENDPNLNSIIDKLRKDEWPDWIVLKTYLAGLDGELPGKTNDKNNQKKSKAELEDPSAEQISAERPEGRSQLDYVRRLVTALKQKEVESNEKFAAIGILGSDIYDKLMLLQALRPEFPAAIFFTTDLSARLTHPAEWKWTRNLIVASHFGLELHPALQKIIPPFRDGYQTSVFYSTLWALDQFHASHDRDYFQLRMGDGSDKLFSKKATPRLYEIGRYGAFDLSRSTNIQSDNDQSIHPSRSTNNSQRSWLLTLIIAGGLLFLSVILLSNIVAEKCLSLIRNVFFWLRLAPILIWSSIAGFAIARLIELIPYSETNEPFTLTDGISAWPTTIIRLLASIMSLFFLWWSWKTLQKNAEELAADFRLGGNYRYPAINADERQSNYLFTHSWPLKNQEIVGSTELWNVYINRGGLRYSALRISIQTLIAMMLYWLILLLLGFPNVPCRGTACFILTEPIKYVSVLVTTILILYVIDITSDCRRWVDCIATKKILWPTPTLISIAQERNHIGELENLSELLNTELIARRTRVIGNFLYFPFGIIFLMAMARHDYIDNWDFPIALIIIVILSAILIAVNVFTLRRSAEKAKKSAINCLKARLVSNQPTRKQWTEQSIEAIRSNHDGAFLPILQHPIFGAIALPSTFYTILAFFEHLATVS